MHIRSLLLAFLLLAVASPSAGQSRLDRVMTNIPDRRGPDALPADEGSVGLWHRLLKLQTTASVMHTTAHPDDEHAGLLTYLSRGRGYRTALLTINRGEAGANAVGSELFDALGMIRTEELRKSARHYGLDDQYFTTFTDYGFSKTLDEALTNWGRERVLEEMVRVIRLNRPMVVISRFHGSERDGHGHHQAAGGITPEAVEAAGDPSRFPEQISEEGLRAWKALKLFRGGVREAEDWTVRVDAGEYSPWLGDSYHNFGYYGLSLQRSQTSGRARTLHGPAPLYYERLDAVEGGHQGGDFFRMIDTSISGIADWVEGDVPVGFEELLEDVERQAGAALAIFRMERPEAVADALVNGLQGVRRALAMLGDDNDAGFLLRIKEAQFQDAINSALGLRISALALPEKPSDDASPWTPLPTMGVAVPGQTFYLDIEALNPSDVPVAIESIGFLSSTRLSPRYLHAVEDSLTKNTPVRVPMEITVPEDAASSSLYFSRENVSENRYRVAEPAQRHTPRGMPAMEVVVDYLVRGERVSYAEVVRTREANLPYGYRFQPLKIAPRIAVIASPSTRIVPLGAQPAVFDVEVDVLNNDRHGAAGELRLELPGGWTAEPAVQPFAFEEAGQRSRFKFEVTAQGLEKTSYEVTAQAVSDGEVFDRGYEIVDQRDLDRHYLYKPARLEVHGIEVAGLTGMLVGYVMGVGDEVPSGIEQLGAEVTLLGENDLEAGDLSRFDVVVVGTRAYAVRQDLLTYNHRLMDYAKAGGHLVVLYQTPEFQPESMAPYPASLPRNAEEVSEEDATITILEPDHAVFKGPNVIAPADFDRWIEQRGSKFFASWDPAYTALVSSHDAGQEPQAGGWLMADYGEGHYTYFAYAIHRQVPFAVAGAYRIFANVLRYGQE